MPYFTYTKNGDRNSKRKIAIRNVQFCFNKLNNSFQYLCSYHFSLTITFFGKIDFRWFYSSIIRKISFRRDGGFRVSYPFPRYASRGCQGSVCGRQGGKSLGDFHRRQETTYAELSGLSGGFTAAERMSSNIGCRLRYWRRLRHVAGRGLRNRQRRCI